MFWVSKFLSFLRYHFFAIFSVGAALEFVPFQKLDFGETAILDIFYNADVVVVDMTVTVQQSPLFYHIGVRESMGMKCNVVIVNDTDPELTVSLRVSRCYRNIFRR